MSPGLLSGSQVGSLWRTRAGHIVIKVPTAADSERPHTFKYHSSTTPDALPFGQLLTRYDNGSYRPNLPDLGWEWEIVAPATPSRFKSNYPRT